MLLLIRNYIQRENVVSTQQLTREFQLDLAALQPMLDIWVAKGIIAQCSSEASCRNSCFKCRTPPQYYRYLPVNR